MRVKGAKVNCSTGLKPNVVWKMYSPTLRRTDDVLFVTARAGFRQTGDGGCVTKEHGPGTNLSREWKESRGEQGIKRGKTPNVQPDASSAPSRPWRYLQLRRHVPEADLSIMAAGDDGAEVVHDQQTADAVGGSCAAPQHYG